MRAFRAGEPMRTFPPCDAVARPVRRALAAAALWRRALAAAALWRRALAAAALLFAAGCATLPAPPQAERTHIGRFSVNATGARQESASGRFELRVLRDTLTLDLSAPLGATLARFETGPDGAQLTVPGSPPRIVRGRNPEELADEVLGYSLPVSGMGDWILGRPAPGREAKQNADGSVIEQDGWTIRVLERFADGTQPRLLTFQRPGAASTPAITLRLVLDAPT
jgi:outer membrane lipoprotein LolB